MYRVAQAAAAYNRHSLPQVNILPVIALLIHADRLVHSQLAGRHVDIFGSIAITEDHTGLQFTFCHCSHQENSPLPSATPYVVTFCAPASI